MSNTSITGERDISEYVPNIASLTEIRVGEVRFRVSPTTITNLSSLNGLTLFCSLHGLSMIAAPVPIPALAQDAMHDGSPEHGILKFADNATNGAVSIVTDLWFPDSRRLRLRIDPQAQHLPVEATVWQVHQIDLKTGAVMLLASKTHDHAGIAFFDAVLRNPFLPVLISVQTQDGVLVDTGVLPFPSLCRGGPHYAELCAFAHAADMRTDLVALSENLVRRLADLRRGATTALITEIGILARCVDDADALFSCNMRDWIGWLVPTLCLVIATVDEDGRIRAITDEDGKPLPAGGVRLDLPEGSLPSLQALLADDGAVSHDAQTWTAGFVVAELGTGHPLWSVGMPPLGDDILSLQPVGSPRPFPLLRGATKASILPVFPVPFAVKFVETIPLGRKVTLLAPVSPDLPPPVTISGRDGTSRVTVLFPDCGRPENGLKALVESLAQQTLSARIDIVAVVSSGEPFEGLHARALLDRSFPGRFVMLDSPMDATSTERLAMAVSHARGEYVMVIDSTVCLHDPRTVSTLMAMASHERVASASCMLVRAGLPKKEMEVVFCSAGLFPLSERDNATSETLHPMDCQDAFPLATYPVAANTPALLMMSAEAVADCGGLSAGLAGTDGSAAHAREKGLLHVCTTAISAGLRLEAAPATSRNSIDSAVATSARFPLSAGLRRLRG